MAKELVRTYTAVLLVALSLAVPAAGQTRRPDVVDFAKIHIDNFGRLNPNYYRGAQPRGRDYEDLAALGVRTLINLTSDDADADEEAMAGRAGLKYVQIPMTTHKVPTSAQLVAFMKVVNDPASQPVYVHCAGGRHRTGVMTAAYRITRDGWTADQAFSEMKRYKFGADFLHPEFKRFVYAYPAQLARTASQTVAGTTKVGG